MADTRGQCRELPKHSPEETEENQQNTVYTVHSYVAYTRVYPKVSGLTAWSEYCKWYGSLALGAVVSLFCESV
jgi:hypothetical protein